MFPLRDLFPSFERPLPPPTFLNIRPEGRGVGRKIGGLMAGCLVLGIAMAQFDGSPATDATATPAAAVTAAPQVATPVAVAVPLPAAEKPRKITQVVCGQKNSARRECADIRAARQAKLAQPITTAAVTVPAQLEAAEQAALSKPETVPATAAIAAEAMAAVTPAETASPPARVAARQKPKKARVPVDDPVVERLVHVYDQVTSDGRRVPVYRRANGGYETGTIVDDEYRPSRRVNLESSHVPHYFGLQ